MNSPLARCTAPVALVLGLGCSQGVAQQGFQHAVPGDALAFVGVDNVAELREGYARSPVGQMWDDPALAPLRAELALHMGEWRSLAIAQLGADPFALPGMLTGPLAIALLEVPGADEAAQAANDSDLPVPLAACMLADVGDNRDACRALLATMLEHLAQDAGLTATKARMGSDDVSVFQGACCADCPAVELCETFHGNVLVLTVRVGGSARPDMQRVLDGLEGRLHDSLASRQDFSGSLAGGPVGLNHQRLWVDVHTLVSRGLATAAALGDLAPEEHDVLHTLGLQDLGAFSMSNRCASDGSQLALRLDWSGNGWIPRLAQRLCQPGTFRLPRYVPANCRAMTGLHADYAGLFDAVVKLLIEAKIVSSADVVSGLAEAEDTLGFNPRDDLLDLLDGETVLVTSEVEPEDAFPGMSADPQNYTLLLGLNDGASLRALVDRLIDGSAFRAALRTTQSHGHTVCNLPLIPHFAISYAILDDVAVVSLSSKLVEDALARHDQPGGLPVLADNPAFTDMVARLQGGYGMISYQDAAGAMRGLFKTLAKLPEALASHSPLGDDDDDISATADDDSEADDADEVDMGAVKIENVHGHPKLDLGPFAWILTLPYPDPSIADKYFHGAAVSAMHVDEHGLQLESVGP